MVVFKNFLMHALSFVHNTGPQLASISRSIASFQVIGMWMEKLSDGVLRVHTALGPRYIKPTFSQRLYLLWIFRNFQVLPFQVLTPRQRKLIETLCVEQNFVALSQDGWDLPILGTVERRPPIEMQPLSEGQAQSRASDVVSPLAADAQQRP